MLLEQELTERIIGAFYRVYDVLGFGFLESVYKRAIAFELTKRGMHVDREVLIDVWYESVWVGRCKADLIIDNKVIVEVKASEHVVAADHKQLMNYLRATTVEVGLLLHFGPKAKFHRTAYSKKPLGENP